MNDTTNALNMAKNILRQKRADGGITSKVETKEIKSFPHLVKLISDPEKKFYVRWSNGPKNDMRPNARSRDYQSGEYHEGLSAIPVEGDDQLQGIFRMLRDYKYLNTRKSPAKAHIYEGIQNGWDSDNAPTIKPTKYVGTLSKKFHDFISDDENLQRIALSEDCIKEHAIVNNPNYAGPRSWMEQVKELYEKDKKELADRGGPFVNHPIVNGRKSIPDSQGFSNGGFANGGPLENPAPIEAYPDTNLHSGPIHSHVAGRTDHLPIHVASGSYVIPADVISGMGEGNTMSGFKVAKSIFSRPLYSDGSGGKSTPYAATAMPYGQDAPGKASGGSIEDHPRDAEDAFRKGWYIHGRAPTKDFKKTKMVQATQDVETANQYGRSGKAFFVKPNHKSKVLDFSHENTEDMDHMVGHALNDFAKKKLPFANDIENALWGRRATPNDIEEHVRSSFAPSSIVDSAQAYDNPNWHEWMQKKMKPDFVKTPDGAISYGHNKGTVDSVEAIKNEFDDYDFPKKSGFASGGSVKGVPIVAAGGEYVIDPEDVKYHGHGSLDDGHKILDHFVKKMRSKIIKTMSNLPPPAKD